MWVYLLSASHYYYYYNNNVTFHNITGDNWQDLTPCLFPYRTERKEFINAKYVEHRFARRTATTATARQGDLYEAVRTRDLLGLVQLHADGVELLEPFPEARQVQICQAASYSSVVLQCGTGRIWDYVHIQNIKRGWGWRTVVCNSIQIYFKMRH